MAERGGSAGALDPNVVQVVQPYQALKPYLCPGCELTIEAGTGHLVIVPTHEPDLRRHWHRGCWYKEQKMGRTHPG